MCQVLRATRRPSPRTHTSARLACCIVHVPDGMLHVVYQVARCSCQLVLCTRPMSSPWTDRLAWCRRASPSARCLSATRGSIQSQVHSVATGCNTSCSVATHPSGEPQEVRFGFLVATGLGASQRFAPLCAWSFWLCCASNGPAVPSVCASRIEPRVAALE